MGRTSQISNKSGSRDSKSGKKKPPHAEIKKRSKHGSSSRDDKSSRRSSTKSSQSSQSKPASKPASKPKPKSSKSRAKSKPTKAIKKKRTEEQIERQRKIRSSAIKKSNVAAKNAAVIHDGRSVIKVSTLKRIVTSATKPAGVSSDAKDATNEMVEETTANIDVNRFTSGVLASGASYSTESIQTMAAHVKGFLTKSIQEAFDNALKCGRTSINPSDFADTTLAKLSELSCTDILLPKGLQEACSKLDVRGRTQGEVEDSGREFVPVVEAPKMDSKKVISETFENGGM